MKDAWMPFGAGARGIPLTLIDLLNITADNDSLYWTESGANGASCGYC